ETIPDQAQKDRLSEQSARGAGIIRAAGEDPLDADRHFGDADFYAFDLQEATFIVLSAGAILATFPAWVAGPPALRSARMRSDAFSARAMVGALVLEEGMVGNTEESTTRRFWTPCTRRSGSTTACASAPM